MAQDTGAIRFFYGSRLGRGLLRLILATHADVLAVAFLSSPLSKPLVGRYIKAHHIDMSPFAGQRFSSFRAFFGRTLPQPGFDREPEHLISPCDALLSIFPIDAQSVFTIKGSPYRLTDLLGDGDLARQFSGGQCLIFRLTPADYHHYCYLDSGRQGDNHFIPGTLHSVQPLACAAYPVYSLNRRCWTVLDTDHFGPVVQCEIGALIVGGIINAPGGTVFRKGEEKGRFDLSGSSIAVLLQKDRARLRPELLSALETRDEVRVSLGEWIATAPDKEAPQ